jgi:hypothetical protein
MEDDYIKKVIFDLMFLGRASVESTAEFKQMKHNSVLVPAFNTKLEEIISLFERYHKVSYDIQGIRDNGVDVFLKYECRSQDISIGLQIKSFNDLEEQAWLNKLKAQVTDAKNCYSLTDFYIIFCTDSALHRDKIRNATASLSQIPKTYVVTPEQAKYFLGFKQHQIAAHIKRKISEDDFVVVNARESLVELTLGQCSLLIEAAAKFIESGAADFSSEALIGSTFVCEVYETYPNIPGDMYDYEYEFEDGFKDENSLLFHIANSDYSIDVQNDLQILSDHGEFELPTHAESIKFQHNYFTPRIAIMYEAIARYGYDGIEMRRYTLMLLKEQEIALAEKVIQLKEKS